MCSFYVRISQKDTDNLNEFSRLSHVKAAWKHVGEIDPFSQFRWRFTSCFCTNILTPKKWQSQTVIREKLHKNLLIKFLWNWDRATKSFSTKLSTKWSVDEITSSPVSVCSPFCSNRIEIFGPFHQNNLDTLNKVVLSKSWLSKISSNPFVTCKLLTCLLHLIVSMKNLQWLPKITYLLKNSNSYQ